MKAKSKRKILTLISVICIMVMLTSVSIFFAAAADTLKRVPSTIPGTDKEYNYVENVTIKIPGTNVTFDFEKVASFVLVDNKYSFRSNIEDTDFDIPVYHFYIFESDGTVTINQDSEWMYCINGYDMGEGFDYSIEKGTKVWGKKVDSSLKSDDFSDEITTIITSNDNFIGGIGWETDIEELKETAIARVEIEKIDRNFYMFDKDYDDTYTKFEETRYGFDNHDETIDISLLDVNYKPNEEYKIIDGANSVVNSDTKSLIIRIDAEFSKFTGVTVDGKAVDSSNYTASEGSTIVEFKGEYLSTLSVGKHTVSILFTDGEATTQFEIKRDKDTGNTDTTDTTEKTDNPIVDVEIPNTNNELSNSTAIYALVLTLIAVTAVIGIAVIRKKKYLVK
ncbi:MAG: hypothetical protein J1F24_00120 [Oscillospiraceae bacterium]|nr:hypothetical protein [Oscillospiraceae bacterium]